MTYRGSSAEGTLLGGCFSLIATIFFGLFIGLQLFSWMTFDSYESTDSINYLSREANQTYEVPTTNYLPAFAIFDNARDLNLRDATINNSDNWSWTFVQSLGNRQKKIDAVNCVDLVKSWTDIDEPSRQSILDELEIIPKFLCPDVSHLYLRGNELGFENF